MDTDLTEMERYLKDSLPAGVNAWSTMGQMLANTFQLALDELPTGKFDSHLINLTGTRDFLSAIEALERKTKSRNALLVIDTLESYKIFSPFMIEGLSGILQAINNFYTDRKMRGITIKFFIPAEIYERAFAGIPGKVGGGTVFMRWNSADLISMLAGRFLTVLERTNVISEDQLRTLSSMVEKAYDKQDGRHLREEFWYRSGFFPRLIYNRLGKEEDCLAYMFRHTFRRPRDAGILQLQAIVNNAVLAGEFPKISAESIIKGVHDDSVLMYILGDAISPFEGPIPGDVISNARSMFYGRPWIMSGRDLRRFARDLYAMHPFEDVEVEDFPILLLRAGVVGLPLDRTSELYCKAGFEYLMPDNLPLRDNLKYCVHPVMGDLFDMEKPEDHRAIYPMPEQDNWLESAANI